MHRKCTDSVSGTIFAPVHFYSYYVQEQLKVKSLVVLTPSLL